MANLGTLWFGADIDLTRLQQKISQGNQGILNALKMDYDPQSYSMMVSKLRSALSRETFEIKISANTQKVIQNVQNATRGVGGAGTMTGLDAMNDKILRQQGLVSDLKVRVAELYEQWKKLGGKSRKNDYLEAQKELNVEKARLDELVAKRKIYNDAIKDTTRAKKEATHAAKEMEKSHIRLNTTLANGVHISTQFGSALSGLFAVSTARDFLNNVIEIGGQLEKQRISMGAIIGDTARANELFENIKGLALKSPFGVVELDQYSKQLAAYGIEQSDLFGMTKRLADISAGAGQDIGRLALALGHVKSATYLTGITLRQFSMNNIPMLKMLADYYSEVEKRAVSTAEVQKRISSRQVSYEDVIEQIKRMTDEGGQFFNMQDKISESLQAKFKNLKDSFDIMYGEIAESSIGDMLKKFAEGATAMSRDWETVARVIGEASVAFGLYKVAMSAVNWATVNFNKNTVAAALSQGKLSASLIDRYVTTGNITKAELLEAVATKKVTVANAELAASHLGITKAQLERIALTGRYVGMLGQTSLATSRFTVAQLRMISALRTGELTAFGKALTGVRLGFSLVATGAKAAGAAVMTFMKPLAGFLAFSAVIETLMEKSRQAEEQEQRLSAMAEKANEGYKNMAETREKFRVGGSADMSDDAITNAIPDMVEQLKNYSETAKETFDNAFAVDKEGKAIHSLKDQYEILAEAIDTTTKAYEDFNKMRPMIEQSTQAATPDKSWLDSLMLNTAGRILPKEEKAIYMGLKESLEFYTESLSDASKAEQLFLRNHLDIVGVLQDMGVADAANMTNEKILETLTMWQTVYPSKFEEFSNRLKGDTKDTFDDVIKQWSTLGVASTVATDRMKKAGEDFYASAKVVWGEDMQKWPASWKDTVLMAMREATKEVKGFEDLSEEAKNDLYNLWLEPFKIKVDSGEAKQQVNNLLVELENLVGKEWVVQIGIKGVSSIDDVDNATKAYKKAMDDVASTRDRLGKIEDKKSEAYKKTLKDHVDAYSKMEAAKAVINQYGGTLPEPETKKKSGGKTSGGTKSDEQLKRWREMKKELEEFWREYETLLKRMNSASAIEEIGKRGLFPSLFDEKGALRVDVRRGLSTAIEDLLKSTDGSTFERRQFQIELKKTKFNIDEKAIQEAAANALKEIQEYISKQSAKYNLYKSLFEKTGNKAFAEAAFSDGRIWDEYARGLEEKLKQMSGEVSIDYDMSDTAAKEHFKSLSGGYDIWKEIVDVTSKNYTDALEKAADATQKILTNDERIAILTDKISKLEADTSGIDHSAEIQQMREEIEKLSSELFEMLPIYETIFGDRAYKGYRELRRAEKAAEDLIKNAKPGARDPKTGKTSFYTSYYMEDGEMKKVTLTRQQLEKLKKVINDFHKDETKKNPFKTFVKDISNLWNLLKDKNASPEEKTEAFQKFAESLSQTLEIVENLAGQLGEMFSSLGNEGLADAMSDVQDGIGSVTNIVSGFAQGGIVGGIVSAAGEAIKWIGKIAQSHDKKLDKAIQKSQREVKKLQNAYKNLEWEIAHQLSSVTQQQSAEMLQDLEKAEKELEKQLSDELAKKKANWDKVVDYRQEIEEAKQQIRTFYEEIGKERYGLDLDAWAGDLASAIVDAFASGEDAAEAFDRKVADIMKSVMSSILKINVIKPAMEQLQNFLFGKNGIATTDSEGGIEITPNELKSLIPQLIKLKGSVESGKSIYDVVASALKSYGIDFESTDSSSSMTSGIKSITEQTADLLASYINAIRADVSVMREMETVDLPAITLSVQEISVLTQTQVQLQTQIAENTRMNAEATAEIERMLSQATRDPSFAFHVR